MSASDDVGNREVAHRVFAAEFDDATFQYSEGDEDRAPNYVVTPTGARVNRLFVVGVLTETERVNEDVLRARIVDPTGAFVVYAGQYQPDELAALERTEPPAFVAVTGKARTFEPDDGDRIFTSVRPESVNEVDADTRDRWVVRAAEHTLDRIATMATAATLDRDGDDLADALRDLGVGESLAAGIPIALDQYRTGPAYLDALRTAALDATRVVAGDRDEVRSPDVAPDATRADAPALESLAESGPGTYVRMTDQAAEPRAEPADGEPVEADDEAEVEGGSEPGTEADPELDEEAEPTPDEAPESVSDVGSEPETEPEPETEVQAEAETKSEPERDDEPEPDEESEPETETEAGRDEEVEPGGAGAESEPAAEDDLGDFEGGSLSGDEPDEAAPATDEMYEFDEDERQEIEEKYGTEFETGTEVGEPGEADIDAPTPEPETEPTDAGSADSTGDETSPDDTDTADEGAAGAVAADADVDDAVMDAMRDLDDGDGADREAVIETVVDATGTDREVVEDAIQDALMGGQCYEPDEGRLKPI